MYRFGTMRDMCILCRSTVAGRNYSASIFNLDTDRYIYVSPNLRTVPVCELDVMYRYVVASYVASLYSYYVGIPTAVDL